MNPVTYTGAGYTQYTPRQVDYISQLFREMLRVRQLTLQVLHNNIIIVKFLACALSCAFHQLIEFPWVNAIINVALLLWKLWAFGFLLDVSETFPCLVCLLLANIVLLLDALQQLMLFVET
jgi:hypothetical protein